MARLLNLVGMMTLALAFSIGAIALSGCGSRSNSTTVSGHISYQQKVVSDGLINFVATGGRPIGGSIHSDGTYSVQLPPGEYKVRIDTPPEFPVGYKEGDALPSTAARQVPEKYANFNSSGLSATVTSQSPHTFDFELP